MHCPPQIGIIPYAGVDITAFELLKQRLLEEHDGRPPPPAVFAAGMLSSCVAQFVSYPLALVRTRMQVGTSVGVQRCCKFLHDVAAIPCHQDICCDHQACALRNTHALWRVRSLGHNGAAAVAACCRSDGVRCVSSL